MSSDPNQSDRRRLLDAAAQILRRRVTPESRYYALVEGIAESPLSPFGESALPYTERLARLADPGQPQVGDMPPQPPTLRGRIGAVLVGIVRRMLFWYTDQIRSHHKRIAEAAREQARVLQELRAAERQGREEAGEVSQRLANQEQLGERLSGRIEGVEQQWSAQAASLREAQASAEEETRRAQAILRQEVEAARRESWELRLRLSEQELLLKSAQPVKTQAPPAPEPLHLDHFFAEHARTFRGDRTEIKHRLTIYLPHAQEAFAATENVPALDLGCGRGEWLEVLREAGIPAQGIDANREFVAACRELGLEALEGRLPQILAGFPDASRSIVSAVHVLEHLRFGDLVEVVDQAVRILKPGGIVIFETPNPRNLFVSSNNFYLDPTHQHPLPSEFLAFVLQSRGLGEPQVMPLEPYPDSYRLQETDSQPAIFINEHFFGPQDYGMVAKKIIAQ